MTIANVQITEVLLKRGNIARAGSYVGPLGEVVIDTTLGTLRIQDGVTPGGSSRLATYSQLANVVANVANIQANTSTLYGNANVAAYLPGYTGNIDTINTYLINFLSSNAQITSGQYGTPNTGWINITANAQHDYSGFYSAENSAAEVYSAQDIQFYANTVGSSTPMWSFGADGNTTLPAGTGRLLFPYDTNSNAIIDNSQDIGQFFILQNNFGDGFQSINLDTDNAQVQISSKNAGGYPLRTWDFDWQGQMRFPDNTIQLTAYQGPAGQTSFATVANVTTANTAMKGYVDTKISNLVNNAPAILDTLGELAANLQADESSITRVALGQTIANTQIANLQANVGSYYIWANANTAGLYNSISGANSAIVTANTAMKGYVDAVTTAWTANAVAQQGLITSANANVTAANATIATLQANVGSFYNYANLTYGTSSYANANVAAYLAGNITSGNATATSFRSNNFLYTNGVSILTGIGGTYSNSNVASYLLTYGGNITTANIFIPSTSYIDFNNTDKNWRMGYSLGAYTKSTAQTTLDVVVGQGSVGPDGFTVGQTGGTSIFELNGYTKNAWFANNVTAVGNITAGNVLATGFFYANGTPFTSSNYGNTQVSAYLVANPPAGTYSNSNVASYLVANPQAGTYSNTNVAAYLTTQTFYSNSNVAAYLVANPQSGTYSNTNVSAYLTSATINTTGNITAGNLTTSGTYTVANITTTGAYGNITGANVISANSLQVSNGIFWANGTAWSSTSGGTTYSNANVVANLANFVTNISTIANITTTANIISPNYLFANGVNILSTVTGGSGSTLTNGSYTVTLASTGKLTFSDNSSTIQDLQDSEASGLGGLFFNVNSNITQFDTGGRSHWPNDLVIKYGGITFTDASYQTVAYTGTAFPSQTGNSGKYLTTNGSALSWATVAGGSGTYSNTNVAAYLTANPISSIANGSSSVTIASSGGNSVIQIGGVSTATFSQSQLNVIGNVVASANIQGTNIIATHYGNSIGTTASYSGNVSANYFVGNGVALTGLTYNNIGNIYGASSNVTLQAGSYSWTFDNTGNLTIPTTGNIYFANGTQFSSGSGGGGTTYSNANVVSMLSANTAVFIGNTGVIGNVATGNIQANATAIFLGANTVISNYGSPTFGYASHIGNNIYFDANGVQRYRNTQTGASDLMVGPGTLYWYASGSAVTANAATGWTGATGAYMAISTSGMSLYNGAGITSAGAITIQNATGLVTNQATTGLFQNASTINAASPSGILSVGQSVISAGYLGNVTIGAGTVQTGAVPLTVRASGTYNIIILSGIAGGYNSPPYNNQAVTGGSGTGMTASYSSVGGYVNQASLVVTNPGTGYKNGDIVGLPGGGGSTAQVYNYNPNISNGTTVGTANYVFGIDGNLALPGNVLYAANSAIYGDFTNSTVNYRTIFRPLAANSNPGVYTAPSGTGTAASWQAANSSNIANASKILIATNGTTDVQLVSGINGTGTYLPMSFYTNGSNQMQLGTGGNLLMVTGGNIATSGNVIAGNIIANQYGNSIGTTATYSGNITASSVIASGSSGPQTRFLWDTWQANSTSALSSFTPSGTIGGNAAWDSTQAYGLKLTTNTTSQSGYINWNSSTINYNYDMVITASIAASGGTGADGQWIYFGSNAAITGNPGNTNTYGGIAVMNHYYSSASQFEVYVGGTQTNIPFIGNGNYVTSGVTLWNASYTSFYNLTLKIRKIQNGNRMLEVYLNEIYQGSVNIGSWTPVGNYFGVAAYTGGSTAQNWVRQLRIDW